MKFCKIFILIILLNIWLGGCASHPPVLPQVPKEGETNMGFSLQSKMLFVYGGNMLLMIILKLATGLGSQSQGRALT